MPWIPHHWFEWRFDQGDCAEAANALTRLRRINFLTVLHHEGTLTIDSMDQHAVMANNLITAAACLPELECLQLILLCHDERIIFAPLTALSRLRIFAIFVSNLLSAVPSDEQVATLREMLSLQQFVHSFTDCNGTLRLLLHAPTPPFCWTTTVTASGAADLGPLLQPLADLTELDVECGCGDVDFVLSLPRVTQLFLWTSVNRSIAPADLPRIVTTLQRCPQLTTLRLVQIGFTSAQLGELLPALPRLTELQLACLPELTSLSFLATEALASSLTNLSIWCCDKVPSAEIVHLLGLRSLVSLFLINLREPLSEALSAQLRAVHPFVQL